MIASQHICGEREASQLEQQVIMFMLEKDDL